MTKSYVFICTNERENKKACANQHFLEHLKQIMKEPQYAHLNVKVVKTGCLGKCAEGPIALVFPENVEFKVDSLTQSDTIIKYLQKRKIG